MGEVAFSPSFDRFGDGAGRELIRLGHPLVDAYLELVAARARWNTVLAQAYDLKVFFSIVDADPVDVVAADVLEFISVQRQPRVAGNVVRIEDGESGLSARTIKRRLSTLAGLYDYLIVRGDVASSPVPKGLASRRGGQRAVRGVPLIRAPRMLPRVIDPAGVDAFTSALRKHRDRAMVDAMLLGGLRRCEVLGLRFEDINAGERRVFIADGKGGHQRVVPVSSRFFDALAAYLCDERPEGADTDRVFVVLKGPCGCPKMRSWALTRGFALHPGTRNRYEIRDTRTQHRPASRQVNDHGRVSGTHVCPEGK